MSREIKSPVERWPGTVTLYDPLDLPQVIAIEDALDATTELRESKFLSALDKARDGAVELTWTSREDHVFLPAIRLCVEKWELENFPLTDSFWPSTPRNDSHLLVVVLWNELLKIYRGDVTIPNASGPTPTDTQTADGQAGN